MTYSIKKGLLKVVKYFLIFLIPALVNYLVIQYPQIYQISAGAVLVGAVNFLKVKGLKLP